MQTEALQITIDWTDETVVLGLAGELDLAVGEELDFAARRLAASTARHVVIDLARLQFMDSCGLRAVLRARETVAAEGRTLTVTNPPDPVKRVFDITGTAGILESAHAGR